MFSPELENLIKATLADGILEPYEKEALVKRAQSEGVDLTELEIYINSILQERKIQHDKEEDARQEQIDKEKRAAFGRVCPNCGRQVPPLTIRCECGFEFGSESSPSISPTQLLLDKISQIRCEPIKGRPGTNEYEKDIEEKDNRVAELISLSPIPSTKQGVIEYLALCMSNSKVKQPAGKAPIRTWIITLVLLLLCFVPLTMILAIPSFLAWLFYFKKKHKAKRQAWLAEVEKFKRINRMASIWRDKMEQVLIKGRSLKGDPDFTKQLDYYENNYRLSETQGGNNILRSI